MYLFGPGVPEELHQLAGGGTPDDGVVNDHHPLPRNGGAQGVELQPHGGLPIGLPGLDKSAVDIAMHDFPSFCGRCSVFFIRTGWSESYSSKVSL